MKQARAKDGKSGEERHPEWKTERGRWGIFNRHLDARDTAELSEASNARQTLLPKPVVLHPHPAVKGTVAVC